MLLICIRRKMRKNIITFTSRVEVDIDLPAPASDYLPEWYKKAPSYLGGVKGAPYLDMFKNFSEPVASPTIKKCLPVFDAMTFGYMLKTPVDINITRDESGEAQFNYNQLDVIQKHISEQVPGYPANIKSSIPKLMNYWSIKTQKGYSCLFVPPMHHENVIQILPGVVDTDSVETLVHFPFLVPNEAFTGIIPAGTPIAQVIPFKREEWKMVVGKPNPSSGNDFTFKVRSTFYDGYRSNFWNRKKFD
jgi:hypothetical protein